MKSLKEIYLSMIGCLALSGFAWAEKGHQVEGGRIIHEPVTHKNLSVFIISGQDILGKDVDYVTLSEAMRKSGWW